MALPRSVNEDGGTMTAYKMVIQSKEPKFLVCPSTDLSTARRELVDSSVDRQKNYCRLKRFSRRQFLYRSTGTSTAVLLHVDGPVDRQ